MNTVSILILLIVFQLIVFSLFLFNRNNPNKQSNIVLACFFLSLAINLLNALCFRVKIILTEYTHLCYIGAPFAFLLGPLFYIYVRSITEEKYSLHKKDIIHFLPFIFYLSYLLYEFYFQSAEWKLNYLATVGNELWKVLVLILNLQIIIYAVSGFSVLKVYRDKIRNMYSSIDKINYSWLKFIFYGIFFLWLADLSRFFSILIRSHYWTWVEIFFFSGFLIFSYVIIYKVIVEPGIFAKTIEFEPKKKKSLSDISNKQYLDRLLTFMENEKPFLDSSLTLFDVSEKTGIPARSISDVINTSLNQNFYDFINSYRIKEAEIFLIRKEKTAKTILEILYQVGFNSKSSFNQAFRKHTGYTPTQFRQQFPS